MIMNTKLCRFVPVFVLDFNSVEHSPCFSQTPSKSETSISDANQLLGSLSNEGTVVLQLFLYSSLPGEYIRAQRSNGLETSIGSANTTQ
ncbi:hypothetical protein FRB91_009141 [Serendipita sp. 411]|nr:hypothetical protein FRB91_009141 [Serendipita sp. 411]